MIVPLYIEYIEDKNIYRVNYIGLGGLVLYYTTSDYQSAKDLYTKLQRECIRELMDFQPGNKDL